MFECIFIWVFECVCRNWFVDSKHFVSMVLCLLWNVLKWIHTDAQLMWLSTWIDDYNENMAWISLHVHMLRTSYCGASNILVCWCVDCHGNGFQCLFFVLLLNVFYRQIYLSRFRRPSLFLFWHLLHSSIQVFTFYCMHSKPGLDLRSHCILSACIANAFSQCTSLVLFSLFSI